MLINVAALARQIGWDPRRAARILAKCGAATKLGGRWVTSLARLRAHFPEAIDIITESAIKPPKPPKRQKPPRDAIDPGSTARKEQQP